MLAKAPMAEPQILLLDEPTKGVDIGAKQADLPRDFRPRPPGDCNDCRQFRNAGTAVTLRSDAGAVPGPRGALEASKAEASEHYLMSAATVQLRNTSFASKPGSLTSTSKPPK